MKYPTATTFLKALAYKGARHAASPIDCNKRQKEQQRLQNQREKAERKNQRKEARGQDVATDEMEELRRYAEEQAATFQVAVGEEPRN